MAIIGKNRKSVQAAQDQLEELKKEAVVTETIMPTNIGDQGGFAPVNMGQGGLSPIGLLNRGESSFFNVVLRVILVPLHWIAVIFEAFLHVKFGRQYINPFYVGFSALLTLPIVFLFGGWTGKLLSAGLGFGLFQFISSFSVFFVLACCLMLAHFIYALATYKKQPRHSRSPGVPWVFLITGNPFFNSQFYILYVQPLIVFAVILFMNIFMGYYEAIWLTLLALFYLIRNIITHQVIIGERVRRNNMQLIGNFEELQEKAKSEQVALQQPHKQHERRPTPVAKDSEKFEVFEEDY